MASSTLTESCRRQGARVVIGIAVAVSGVLLHATAGQAQTRDELRPAERRVTIPYLARAGTDIEFAAAECDIAADGAQMTCRFRQVFVTVASTDATACVITTNGYDQTFRRASSATWISSEGPDGPCGRLETTTLDDGGATQWTMTIESRATNGLERAECRASAPTRDVFSWRDVKRPLPCATIQPGAIER